MEMPSVTGKPHFSIKLISCIIYILISRVSSSPLAGNRDTYDLVDADCVTPQWLRHDQYEVTTKPEIRKLLRFPPLERRFGFTHTNQDLVVLSSRDSQLIPSAGKLLQLQKSPIRLRPRRVYQPLISTGVNARHKFAEGLHVRHRQIGSTDEFLIAFLYTPTGWPLFLVVTFICCLVLVPIIGAFLVNVGSQCAKIYMLLLWLPLKTLLRWILIKYQLNVKFWQEYIAPPHFLEPRTSWRMPFFLRNDNLEDIPYELTYKPPINKIDYTMYILTEEDYDEMDLGMDEMEFIDDLLQFRNENPKVVARLLKHKLGVEKFYYYFDEDVLSDESDDGEEPPLPEPVAVEEETVDQYDYLKLLQMDEPWMHPEYDATFTGSGLQLEEIRKRRQIIQQLKEEIRYLHTLVLADNMFDKHYDQVEEKERKKLLKKSKRLMDKFERFSNITKARVAEIEPSSKIRAVHNPALSKYLPLIDQMGHYNHRLNLKHEKQREPGRRKLQLEIFGGP